MNPSPSRAAGVRGATVVELVLAIAVVAILAALAVPSLRDFTSEQRSRGAMSQLVADLNFARLEAIKRNTRVLLCPRDAVADTPCSSANWGTGWVVCYSSADSKCDTGTTEDPNPMKVANALQDTLTLTSPAGLVNFTPIGTSTGEVVFTLVSGTATRTGTVTATGNVSSKKTK